MDLSLVQIVTTIVLAGSTVVLAIFTAFLWRNTRRYANSTDRMARTTEKYTQVLENSLEIQKRSLEMERLDFYDRLFLRFKPGLQVDGRIARDFYEDVQVTTEKEVVGLYIACLRTFLDEQE